MLSSTPELTVMAGTGLPRDQHLLRKRDLHRSSIRFLREAFFAPRKVGAIAPTSRRLAEHLVETAGVPGASKIVELGAGTGAITRAIMKSKAPAAKVFALERNPSFASVLEKEFPELRVICHCVSHLREDAYALGFERADAIISALPWTIFSDDMQRHALEAASELLAPSGIFTTVACAGLNLAAPGRRFRKLLGGTFRDVRASPVIWSNLPPAFVYRCVR